MPTQSPYHIRLEWSEQGLRALAPTSDVILILDVLSFSTTVDIALAHGVTIYPHPGDLPNTLGLPPAQAYAEQLHAQLALPRGQGKYSLSPASFLQATPGERIVLPSINGAYLSLLAAQLNPNAHILTACLRNAQAVATRAATLGTRISLIPAGERWPDRSLRPALEDLLAASVILEHLHGSKSPEALFAESARPFSEGALRDLLTHSVSARELITGNHPEDVRLASRSNSSTLAPTLANHAYAPCPA